MSKYTAVDADVTYLESYDRVQFEFDMMQHDPDKLAEASYSWMAFKDPKQMIKEIEKKMKNWRTAGDGVILLLCFLFSILFLVTLITLIVLLIIYKGGWKVKMLFSVLVSVFLMFAVLLILFGMYNKVYGNTKSLIGLSQDPAGSARAPEK